MNMLETVGRICHASASAKTVETADRFVRMLIRLGHESVLEHVSVTVIVECDRAMAQQWTRHRLAAYTMESQRYVTYKEVRFVDPEFRSMTAPTRYYIRDEVEHSIACPSAEHTPEDVRALYSAFEQSCTTAEHEYQMLRNSGAPPEDARSVLPNSTRTLFYTTANLRVWRHIFNMRCAVGAQHNIRRVMLSLLGQFNALLPAVFGDLAEKFEV
jgi:thymidylate synthase (FAD)